MDNVCVAVCNRLKFSSIVGRFLFFGTGHHDQFSDIIVYFRMIWGRNIQLTQSVCKRLCFREIVNWGWIHVFMDCFIPYVFSLMHLMASNYTSKCSNFCQFLRFMSQEVIRM